MNEPISAFSVYQSKMRNMGAQKKSPLKKKLSRKDKNKRKSIRKSVGNSGASDFVVTPVENRKRKNRPYKPNDSASSDTSNVSNSVRNVTKKTHKADYVMNSTSIQIPSVKLPKKKVKHLQNVRTSNGTSKIAEHKDRASKSRFNAMTSLPKKKLSKRRVVKPIAPHTMRADLLLRQKRALNMDRTECSASPEPTLVPITKRNVTDERKLPDIKSELDNSTSSTSTEEIILQHKQAIKWLLSPVGIDDFFSSTWQNNPLHISRNSSNYFAHILTTAGVDGMLRKNQLHFGKNVDVVSYTNGARETHNLEGRALPAVVWDFYSNGCSVRILNPQTYCRKLHKLIASLQEYFGCMVGANLYLTPANSQGFAPHYDDIDAFVIQLEGEKKWKLYNPRSNSEILPIYSSENFTQEEIGTPVMDVTLKAGDLLYFPRGVIHQAETSNDVHSLHITLSTYQRTTWSDLLEKLLPAALKVATKENVNFRRGLPLHYLRHLGVVNSENTGTERNAFINTVNKLVTDLIKHAPIDRAVDEMGKQFMHDALPPIYTENETNCSVCGDGERLENGVVKNRVEIGLNTRIRLLRYYAIRLVLGEDDTAKIYHCVDNSMEYHGQENQYLEIDLAFAPAVEKLQCNYPYYLDVEELPLDKDSDKLQLVGDLWERGLIVTLESLDVMSD